MKTKNNIVVSTNHKIVFGSIHKVLTLLLISFLASECR
jgi:hypothetical protein